MIKYIVKFLLVILILTNSLTPVVAFAQDDEQARQTRAILSNNVDGYFELADNLAEATKQEFDQIFEYLPGELSESQKIEAITILDIVRSKINNKEIEDPKYPAEHWGKFSSAKKVPGGMYEVTWFDGEPVIVVTLEKQNTRNVVVGNNVDQTSGHFKRFLYHLHVFGGDEGYGVSDIIGDPPATTRWGRFKDSFKKAVVKKVRRGVDVNIITIDKVGEILNNQISRRPKWLSGKWWKEYWGAMHSGRPVTVGKVLKGIGIAAIPATAAWIAGGAEIAAVTFGFVAITQAYYSAYFTYKFTNSPLMQILKLGFVSMISNMTYMALAYGSNINMELIMHAAQNAVVGIVLFHEWRLSKQLLVATGENVGTTKIIPGGKIKVPKSMIGKKIKVFGKEFVVPDEIVINPTTMDKAKLHDTISDLAPGTGRQVQLVYMLPAELALGLALVGHGYTQLRYEMTKKKNPEVLNKPEVKRIMENVFYRKLLRDKFQAIKKACNWLYTKAITRSVTP